MCDLSLIVVEGEDDDDDNDNVVVIVVAAAAAAVAVVLTTLRYNCKKYKGVFFYGNNSFKAQNNVACRINFWFCSTDFKEKGCNVFIYFVTNINIE